MTPYGVHVVRVCDDGRGDRERKQLRLRDGPMLYIFACPWTGVTSLLSMTWSGIRSDGIVQNNRCAMSY